MPGGFGFGNYVDKAKKAIGGMLGGGQFGDVKAGASSSAPAPQLGMAPWGDPNVTNEATWMAKYGKSESTAIPGFGADAGDRRPETTTADDNFDPASEHSPSSTASMVGLLLQRTSAGGTGAGKAQYSGPSTPFQRQQFEKMGLAPAELDMLQRMGAAKQDALPATDEELGEPVGAPEDETSEYNMSGEPGTLRDPTSPPVVAANSMPRAAQDATRVAPRGVRR